ncbi:hypothetical protein G6F56_004242 [Rhizopus delemar]|nr:hypothetical protein G6F56_004242 [Rhizopus delemar]
MQGYCLNSNRINQAQGLSNINVQRKPNGHLRLTIHAFGSTYYLNLEPNLDLFHPEAVIHQDVQSIDFGIPYKGRVMQANADPVWYNQEQKDSSLGWARIIIQKREDQPLMIEGAFKVHEDMYHIKAKDTYHQVKRSGDPDMYATSDPMVIYRDSVVTKSIQEESKYNECGKK